MPKFTLLIHGGAGNISAKRMTPEQQADYRAVLERALGNGSKILAAGGAALDAVESAVRVLEDSPLFNAGRGAVFTAAGTQEMDACMMDGATRDAGAVSCVSTIRNPITAARAVLHHSPHVLLVGEGAEAFAKEQGVVLADTDYFFDQHRWDQLQALRGSEKLQLDFAEDKPEPDKYGTVGAVACDMHGNLAAATSTGGLTNKRAGRVGDTPMIGAGCYAENESCAVSCTGQGEFFMRGLIAADVALRMKYQSAALEEAAKAAIGETLKKLGGTGGLIAVDAKGNFAMPFNTTGMFRGVAKSGQSVVIEMFR